MAFFLTLPRNFKVGADPELFIVDDKGQYVSAEGLIPGTKAEPYKVPGGAVQVDGMAAEFNIDPVTCFDDFDFNIDRVVQELRNMLPKGYSLQAKPSVVFSEEVWDAVPDIAKELGCSPDFNAWTGAANPPPNPSDNPRMRTAAGHIHIGWTSDMQVDNMKHISHAFDLVKQLDYYLGAWSVTQDADSTRRSLYGKAGACRVKSYGVEYRVLSNFWVLESSKRLNVWNRLVSGILNMRNQFYPAEYANFNAEVIESINTSTLSDKIRSELQRPVLSL